MLKTYNEWTNVFMNELQVQTSKILKAWLFLQFFKKLKTKKMSTLMERLHTIDYF